MNLQRDHLQLPEAVTPAAMRDELVATKEQSYRDLSQIEMALIQADLVFRIRQDCCKILKKTL